MAISDREVNGGKETEGEGDERKKMGRKKELKHTSRKSVCRKPGKEKGQCDQIILGRRSTALSLLSGAWLKLPPAARAPAGPRPVPHSVLKQQDCGEARFGVRSSTERGNPYLQLHPNAGFLQALVFQQSEGRPDTCHPADHWSPDSHPVSARTPLPGTAAGLVVTPSRGAPDSWRGAGPAARTGRLPPRWGMPGAQLIAF